MGSFRFGASEGVAGEPLPNNGGARFVLTGKAWISGQGRSITAQEISFDVPKGASDISIARASGSVRMSAVQKGGRKLAARGSSLVYNRAAGKIDLGGGVNVRSDLADGGSMTATGSSAEVLLDSNTATLSGGVRLTLVKPDTLSGPAVLTGANMTVDLNTGKWKIFGGPTNGNFNLQPKTGKQ
jgi:lipopolysaccharide export system protein LptA